MKKLASSVVLLGMLTGSAFAADMSSAGHKHDVAKPATAGVKAAAMADGVVRGVDLTSRTITVDHGPIPSLQMDAMTMPYHVKDPGMLKAVKPGDKIKMSVEVIGSLYTITALQKTQ